MTDATGPHWFHSQTLPKSVSTKQRNWPSYRFRQTVLFVTRYSIVNHGYSYRIYSFSWTKRTGQPTETWTKANHEHLAASPCVAKHWSPITVTNLPGASETNSNV